jgi:hypothetical protein
MCVWKGERRRGGEGMERMRERKRRLQGELSPGAMCSSRYLGDG